MNALSEYQLTISLAAPRSRKFCSVSLACHHFSAALFHPTDLCSISTCTLKQPSYCLSLSLFLSLSVFISLSHFLRLHLFGLTPNTAAAATGSDQRIGAASAIRNAQRGPRSYVRTCVIPCVKLCALMCDLCKIVCVCV